MGDTEQKYSYLGKGLVSVWYGLGWEWFSVLIVNIDSHESCSNYKFYWHKKGWEKSRLFSLEKTPGRPLLYSSSLWEPTGKKGRDFLIVCIDRLRVTVKLHSLTI